MKAQKGWGVLRYNSIHSLTLALDVGGWSTPIPDRCIPWKETQ